MERKLNTVAEGWDLNHLLHPAQAFGHPLEVVNDPDLSLNEKRAILASWASDACAVEAAPELRSARHGCTVRFDDSMEALRTLDKQANGTSLFRIDPAYSGAIIGLVKTTPARHSSD